MLNITFGRGGMERQILSFLQELGHGDVGVELVGISDTQFLRQVKELGIKVFGIREDTLPRRPYDCHVEPVGLQELL